MWTLFCAAVAFFIIRAMVKSGSERVEIRSKEPSSFKYWPDSDPDPELRDTDRWGYSKRRGWAYFDKSLARNANGSRAIKVFIDCETGIDICLSDWMEGYTIYSYEEALEAFKSASVEKYKRKVESYRQAASAADKEQVRLFERGRDAYQLEKKKESAARLAAKSKIKADIEASKPVWSIRTPSTSPAGVCHRCEGSGYLSAFRHVENGRCFLCQGSGRRT
ncbi:hypothetical protein [Shewanella sp. UCD-KL12]|uniref:hypothetical protein n=1 Tax=Shewanella sp. UCD-KL12 TaxID=1917163 RepID=UPI000970345B|nr:hypothetical protein [Shewanella sp. UCD-KL12]